MLQVVIEIREAIPFFRKYENIMPKAIYNRDVKG